MTTGCTQYTSAADKDRMNVKFSGPPNKKHETFLTFMILISV